MEIDATMPSTRAPFLSILRSPISPMVVLANHISLGAYHFEDMCGKEVGPDPGPLEHRSLIIA